MQVLQWLGRLASESPPSLALSSTPTAFVLQLHSRHRASPRGPSGTPFWTLQTIAARCLRRSGSRVGCTGTSCRKALFSSASKSDLGLSSAWLLLVATFNTTNAWLSFKVTRPCTGIDILSCMLTGGRVAMLRAESYKLWSEGGDASL